MKRTLCILIVLFLAACAGEGGTSPPEGLIPKDELVALLIDLEIMEAYYEQVHKRFNVYKTTLDSASRRILVDRNITEEQLKTTLNYYTAVPDSIFLIYETALDSLNSAVMKNKIAEDE